MKSEWADLLQDALQDKAEAVPDGFRTCKEIARELGLSTTHAVRKLAELRDAGRIETGTFKVLTGRGLYPTPHYRIIAKCEPEKRERS